MSLSESWRNHRNILSVVNPIFGQLYSTNL